MRGRQSPRRAALLCLAGIVLFHKVFGGFIDLRPSADTSLFSAFPENNFGAASNMVAGANGSGFPARALLRFDLAGQIPPGSVALSAILTLDVVIVPGGGGTASVFDLRRVLADWGEGGGTGNTGVPAAEGEAAWNSRFHPSPSWSVPGGAVGNDFAAPASASRLIGGPGAYSFDSTPGLVADIEEWRRNPSGNFGWVLMSESESVAFTAKRFGTREDPSHTPLLRVRFAFPPEIQSIGTAANQVQFSFSAPAGQNHTVQYQDALGSGPWLNLTNFPPLTATANLIVLDSPPATAQRFYRIIAY